MSSIFRHFFQNFRYSERRAHRRGPARLGEAPRKRTHIRPAKKPQRRRRKLCEDKIIEYATSDTDISNIAYSLVFGTCVHLKIQFESFPTLIAIAISHVATPAALRS